MKHLFSLIAILASVVFSQTLPDSIYVERNEDGQVHNGLPSWDVFEDDSTVVQHNSEGAVIKLPSTHAVRYMSNQYNALTIYPNGQISLGEITPELDKALEPYVLPVQGIENVGVSFAWKALTDSLKNNYIAIHFSHFLKSDKYYSVQVSLYADGEIQVQLWQDDVNNASIDTEDWMNPIVYNGSYSQEYKRSKTPTYVLYNKSGLRPGLVVKPFNNYNVRLSEPYGIGGGLHVEMGHTDDGAMIGFDHSREHPVTGGISSVFVKMKDAIQGTDYLYIWHFLQFKKTYIANYPSLVPGAMFFTAQSDLYRDSDNNVLSSHPFHPADGFRFQVVLYDPGYNFTFESVVYTLKQLPLVQFRSPKPFTLTFSIVGSGRVAMNYPEVASPIPLYKGQKASASIISKAGSSIKKITINGEVVVETVEKTVQESDGSFSIKKYTQMVSDVVGDLHTSIASIVNSLGGVSNGNTDKFSYRSLVSPASDKPYTRMNFNVESMSEDLNVEIEFEPCGQRTLPYVVPKMEVTETYLDPQSQSGVRKVASASIHNAFGKVVQQQDSLSSGQYIVKATYTDGMDKAKYSPMAFVRDTSAFGYLDMYCEACIDSANAYYNGHDPVDRPNALGYAYSEHNAKYGNQDGSYGVTSGIAEASFEYATGHAESWGFPASSKDDFIKVAYLNPNKMKEIYVDRLANPGSFHLTIKKDNEGRYTQEISDEKGRKVSMWSYDGKKETIVINDYNEYDQLIKTYIKGKDAFYTSYKYDEMGRKIREYSKDKDSIYYAYDSYGRLKMTQTAAQKEKGRISVNLFDGENRLNATGELTSGYTLDDVNLSSYSNFVPSVRNIYGFPELDTLQKYGITVNSVLLNNILGNIENIRDNDIGAIIAYDSKGVASSVKFSSFNRSGQKTKQWIVYTFANVPAVQLTYGYNSASEMISSSFMEWNGSSWTEVNKRTRHYDGKGKLDTIYENDKLLATYVYSNNGNVVEKNYYDKGILVYTKRISRDVYGRPTEIKYVNGNKVLYKENVSFTSPLVPRTVSTEHTWGQVSGFASGIVRNNQYEYDYSGRLIAVAGDSNSTYGYDDLGRLERKLEGNSALAYAYNVPGSYRASGYYVKGRNFTPTFQYFEYDASGNIWLDRYHKVAYELDSRGLPEKVRKFSSIPDGISLTNMDVGVTSGEQTAEIDMAYDETGSRIWYAVDSAGLGYTEVTFPGVGIYSLDKNSSGTPAYTLDREVLVAGGFRKGGIAYYPVTDVQGNVRGYVSKNGLESAYDYYPYGSVIDLAVDNTENRDRWQGKEFDGEHGKYFFGSRYFDPFFGLWMTPDPAGQFANPYTYGGDPLNYIDPNGESITAAIIIGAAVGAAVGGAMSYVQCSGPTEQSCGRAAAIGAGIGAVSGAASGGVGSAVGGAIGGLGGAVAGGAAGGATSGVVNYAANSLVYGQSMDGMGLWTAVWQGALSGAVSGGAGYGLRELGAAFGGAWSNPATYMNIPSLNQGISSAIGSMSVAAVNAAIGEGDWSDLGSAAAYGAMSGTLSSMTNSLASLLLIHSANLIGGRNAVEKLFDPGDGYWADEFTAAVDAEANPGTVMGAVANDWKGWLISIFSGGGPISHVRGSDANGRILETNDDGTMDYWDNAYDGNRDFDRLTYVTKRYVGMQSPSITTSSIGWQLYFQVGMCTGGTHMINPGYKGGAPNNLLNWQYRHAYTINIW